MQNSHQLCLLSSLILFCSSVLATDAANDSYQVARVAPAAVQLDGLLEDPAWGQASVLSQEFHNPWQEETVPETRFQAVWDGQYLYFCFFAQDSEIVLVETVKKELDIGAEDRVELFFAQSAIEEPVSGTGSSDLPRYYGIEIDALGRVLDFSAYYYRQFDFLWQMKGLETAASQNDEGYTIEARIPLKTLRELELLNSKNGLIVGVFRGDFSQSATAVKTHWISWIDPKTLQPDFHVSEAFGHFLLMDTANDSVVRSGIDRSVGYLNDTYR